MSSKNINNEAVITNYSDLLEAKQKYHTAENSLLYYNFMSNRAVSVNGNDAEKKYAKNYAGGETIASNRIKYPNYLQSGAKLKAKNKLCTDKRVDCQKAKSKQKDESPVYHHISIYSDNGNKIAEGKLMNNNQKCICNGNDILTSNAIKHLNFYEACSELKGNHHSCSVRANLNKEKLQSQNDGKEYLCEDACLQDSNSHVELQTVIDENEKLKIKLKVVVESLREILITCEETDEGFRFSKIVEDCQNKQERHQDDCFKFPQMYHLKETIDSFGPDIKHQQRTVHPTIEGKMIILNGVLDTPGNRSDSEWARILDSKQCLIELQKQNGLIIRNLKELKENLRDRFKGREFPNNKIHHYSTVGKKTTNNSSRSVKTSVILKEKIVSANKSNVRLKNESEILREMVKFSKLMKDKGSWVKDNESINSIENSSEYAIEVNQHSNLNKVSGDSKKALFPPLLSNAYKKFPNKGTIQKKNTYKKNDIDKFCKWKGNSREETAEVHISPNSLISAGILMKNASPFKTNHKSRHSYPKYNKRSRPSLSKAIKSSGDIAMVLQGDPALSIFSKRRKEAWK